MAANYTTKELNIILDKIDLKLQELSTGLFNSFAFGFNCVNLCNIYRLRLYKSVILTWNQNDDGSTDDIYNSITREQFYNIITTTLNYLK